jgi:hypothetical protein
MRKRLIDQRPPDASPAGQEWLDLEQLARVEVTSEDTGRPIESALVDGPGWRAAEPGEQTIRLLFDLPLRLRRIHLVYREDEQERTQEFVLRWSSDGGRTFREILRQQYHFSPPGTVAETEDYRVDLDRVTALELSIVPSVGGGRARASLTQLRLA